MITIYGTGGCLACLKTKNIAEMFELEHEYIDLSKADIETKKKFFAIDKTNGKVPQAVWEDKVYLGLEEFEAAVNNYIRKTIGE